MTERDSRQDVCAAFWVVKHGGNQAQIEAGQAVGELREAL